MAIKNKDKRFADDIERWSDLMINIGFDEVKPSQLASEYKIYTERNLDTDVLKMPDWLLEYFYLVTKVIIPDGILVSPIVGYYRGYYLLFKLDDMTPFPTFDKSRYFIKTFDAFSEFDGVFNGKVTTHNSSHKGVTTVRSRLAFTGKEIGEIGLEVGDDFNILYKKKKGGHPGFLIFQKEDD